jgi:flagellar hook-basal body complex protein FliE
MDGIKSAGLSALQAYGGAAGVGTSSPETNLIGVAGGAGGGESSFAQMLSSAVDSVQAQGQQAETQSAALVAGQGNLVDVVTAIAETEVALETMVSVRDKVISAYEEIMRMPM